jgi:hypothetical protein
VTGTKKEDSIFFPFFFSLSPSVWSGRRPGCSVYLCLVCRSVSVSFCVWYVSMCGYVWVCVGMCGYGCVGVSVVRSVGLCRSLSVCLCLMCVGVSVFGVCLAGYVLVYRCLSVFIGAYRWFR